MAGSEQPVRVLRDRDVQTWQSEWDAVVVGAGAGGLAVALLLRQAGLSVAVLEGSDEAGGTARKSAAGIWIPDNSFMQRRGVRDDRDATLNFMARLAFPDAYDSGAHNLGLQPWAMAALTDFYDFGPEAIDALADAGAFPILNVEDFPEYHADAPENANAPAGRVVVPGRLGAPTRRGVGEDMIQSLLNRVIEVGVPVITDHRVTGVVEDESGRIVGVTLDGKGMTAIGGTAAVVFATGGFTHNDELRRRYLPEPILGGCAVRSNTGEFVAIAEALGAPLENMTHPWMAPECLAMTLSGSPDNSGIFEVPGDSMLWVDRFGDRVVNEKRVYHEAAAGLLAYDEQRQEYSRRVMVMIWDSRSMRLWGPRSITPGVSAERTALDNFGNIMFAGPHVVEAATVSDLVGVVRNEVARWAEQTGGLELDADFEAHLDSAIARFNELAITGDDDDQHRGRAPIEQYFTGPGRDNPYPNPTMHPLSEEGPYYATLIAPATLDTKGGARTTTAGEVIGSQGTPIDGLYGVGNCVASASGEAYWAGGSTLGPIYTSAYLAAKRIIEVTGRG